VNTEALANRNALALILIRICIYQFCKRLDSLTLFNAGAVTFQPVAIKVGARDLLDCIVMPVIRNRYSKSLFIVYSSVSSQYYSLFNYLLHFSFEFCFDCCLKRKEQF
jgi:hypothetical protein